jgi:hypothetical protein
MTSNTVNISTTAVKMSNLRQSLNIFNDPISISQTRNLRSSFPSTNTSNISLNTYYKNYINAFSPLICLDANNYTIGSNVWLDSSGNNYNFTVSSNSYSNINGVKYMNFSTTNIIPAITTSGTNIPLTYANGTTILAFSQISNNNSTARTLLSGMNFSSNISGSSSLISSSNYTVDTNYNSVSLLLHADSILADNSPNNATLTSTALTYNTTTYKFGSASFSFNGTSTLFDTPTSTNYAFDSGDFTIEFWAYFNSTSGQIRVCGNSPPTFTTNKWLIGFNSGKLQMQTVNSSSTWAGPTATITTGSWSHYAFVRSGANLLSFINGTMTTDINYFIGGNSTIDGGTSTFIRFGNYAPGGDLYVNGLMDDIRITKGVARYTANFTVPTSQFPNSIYLEYLNPIAGTYLQNSANWTNPNTATNTISLIGYAYGNGTYIASASSAIGGYSPWNIFKKLANQDWATAGSYYSSTTVLTAQTPTGATTQMTVSISGTPTTIYGEWVQIQLPFSILLNAYTFNGGDGGGTGQTPNTWIIAASFNGTTWVQLDARSGVGTPTIGFQLSATYTITGNTIQYSYYRFIVRAVNGGGYAALSQWTLYTSPVSNQYINPAATSYLQTSTNWTNPTTTTNTISLIGYAYGDGTYTTTASSIFNTSTVPWNCFTNVANTQWTASGSYYTGTTSLSAQTATGATTQITVSGSTVYGEWIQIQLPYSIILNSYTMNGANTGATSQTPYAWTIAGSSDGSTWFNLDSRSAITASGTGYALYGPYYTTNNNTYYKYYRFIVQAVNGGGYLTMSGWTLYTNIVYTEYPPVALTTNPTTTLSAQSYGNGSYTTTASSIQGTFYPYLAFDKLATSTGNDGWMTGTILYSTTNGSYGQYTGGTTYPTTISGTTRYGEWIQIQLPSSFVLSSYSITNQVSPRIPCAPYTWYLAGSTDGSTWTQVDFQSAQTVTTNLQVLYYTLSSTPAAYSYYRFVIIATQANAAYDGRLVINEIKLFSSTSTSEYPPVALSTSSLSTTVSGQNYGNGTYIVSYSSEGFAGAGYYLYDKSVPSSGGTGSFYATGYNAGTPGTYASTTYSTVASGITYYGQWHSLQLPSAIYVTSYSIQATNDVVARSPASWIVAGSNDGSTWTLLDSQTGYTWTGGQLRLFNLSTQNSYLYLRILFRSIQGNDAAIQVGEVRWYSTATSSTSTINVLSDKHVTINSSTNSLGIFDNINGSGFNATTSPSAFDVSTIPSYSNNFNMLVIKEQTSSPYYQVKYNGQSGNNYYINNSSINSSLKSGIGYIGGSNVSEKWGNIGLVMVYNTILTDNQISDIYLRFAPRFIYNYPPISSGLVGYFTGESWSGSTIWNDVSGLANNATLTSGKIFTYNSRQPDSAGIYYQSVNGFTYLAGGSNAVISFPSSVLPSTSYTLFWVARYAGSNLLTQTGNGNKGVIFNNNISNSWASGFSNALSGVAIQGGTYITKSATSAFGNGWIIGCDQSNLFRANGSNYTISTGNLTSTPALYINYLSQPSDWMVASVIGYNRILTSSEILTTEYWLSQKYNLSTVIYPLSTISTASACVGAFSLYQLSSSYTGPVVKVRNGTTNVTMDFYGDMNGNLTIAQNNTGISLTTWLSGAIAYVDTWYDQSGFGSNAFQGASYDGNVYQPFIDTTNRMVSFKTNGGVSRLKLPNGTIPFGDSSYTVMYKHNTITGTGIIGSGAQNVTSGNNSFGLSSTNYNNYWFGNDATTNAGNLVATGNVVTFKYTTGAYNNRTAFINGTTQSLTFTGATTIRSSTNANNYIGIGDLQNVNYFNGELYHIYIFNNSLSYSDQNILEQSRFYVAPLSSSYVSSITNNSATVGWSQTNGYQYTQISWNSGANTANVNYGTSTFNNFTSTNILLPNYTYSFTLTPYYYMNTTGNSATVATGIPYTSAAVSTSNITTLPFVTGLNVSSVTVNSMTLGWTAAGATPTYNNVVLSWSPSTAGSPATAITALSGTITYTSPTNLAFNTQYTFTITPYNSLSVVGSVQTATSYTLPGSLSAQTATATNNGTTATITWTDTNSPAATNYSVTWSSGSTTTSAKTYTTGTLTSGTYSFTITPINANSVANSGGTITTNSITINAAIVQLTQSSLPSVSDLQNTVLLLNFNGFNNGSIFTDSSPNNQQFSATGSPILTSKIQPKFGLTSGYFPGGSFIQSSANILNNIGSANFSIEFWFNWNGVGQNPGYPQTIISNNNSSLASSVLSSQSSSGYGYTGSGANSITQNAWSIGLNDYNNSSSSKMCFKYYNQIPSVTYSSVSVVPQNTWTHYAFVRSGNTIYVFVNGILESQGFIPLATYIDDGVSPTTIYIGCGLGNQYLYGYLNDLRLMTNIAKYTANFTVPDDTNYDIYDYNTILLLHGNGANNGTSITDSSVYNNTLTNVSTTTSTTQSYFAGSSLSFNGTTSYLRTPLTNTFTFQYSNFTIEFWVYPTNISSNPRLFSNAADGASFIAGIWIIILQPTLANFSMGPSTTMNYTTTINNNTWYHFAYVRLGNTLTVYQNGVSLGSQSLTASIDSGANNILNIGYANFSGNQPFQGYLAELRITKGLARYTAAFQVPSSPFKPYLNSVPDDPVVLLLHGEGSIIADSSYYNTQFTTTGSPAISTTQFKFGSASINFPGSAGINTPSAFLYTFGANDFTIEFWSYATTYNTIRFTGNLTGAFAANNWYLGTNSSSQLILGVYNINTSAAILTATSAIPINCWNHIALVRNGNNFMIFINGVLNNSTTSSLTIDNGITSKISFGYDGQANFFTGYLDEICITKNIAKYTGNFKVPIAAFLSAQPYDISNASTVLLLHADGIHNSSGIVDSSYYQTTISNTLTTISNIYNRFGNSSMYFNGSAFINTPSSTLYAFGSNNFTIEFWLYLTATPSGQTAIVGNSSGTYTTNSWAIVYYNTGTKIAFLTNNQSSVYGQTATSPSLNTWIHYAFVRNGNSLLCFQNGNMTSYNSYFATTNISLDAGAGTAYPIYIGTDNTAGATKLTGYIDEFRITNGIARYTANFASPSTPFQPYISYIIPNTLLLHFDGTNFIDSSHINATLTLSATAPTLTTATTSPVSSTVASFVGTNNTYVATSSAIYYVLSTFNFTIEFWFNATSISSTSYLLFNKAYGTTYAANMWNLGFNSSNNLVLYIYNVSSNTTAFITTNTVFSTATWYHIAIVRNNTTFMIYVNGVIDNVNVTSASMDGGNSSLICIGSIAASNSFTGFIDEFLLSVGYAKYSTNFTVPSIPINSVIEQNDIPASATILLLHGDGANAGTTITDSSYYQNAISNTSVTTSTTKSVFGNTSLSFNGAAKISTASSTTYSFATANFTIEFWFNANSVTTTQLLYSNADWGTNHFGIVIISSTANVQIYNYSSGSFLFTGPAISANVWYHLALTRSGNTLTLYLNGVSAGIYINSGSIDSGGSFPAVFGAYPTTGSFFTGYIDEIRITKGFALYTGNFNLPPSPFNPAPVYDILPYDNTILLLHAEGTNGTITSVTDSSYYGVAVTPYLTATPSYSTSIYKFGTSSFSFNGYANSVMNVLRTGLLPGLGSNDFTIEFWIYVPSFASQMRYMGNFSSAPAYEIGNGAGAQPFFNSNLGLLLLSGVGTSTWTHIAFVRYNNRLYGYVNGTLSNSMVYNGSIDSNVSYTIDIGGCGYNSGQPNATFTGNMDEIRITKGLARYTSNFSVQTGPFSNGQPISSAVTLLLHCEGPNGSMNIQDSSPYQNSVTSYNYAQLSTANSVLGGSSLYLPNGGTAYVQSAITVNNNLGTGDFTIEFWFNWSGVYSSSGGANQRIMSNSTASWAANTWIIGWDNASSNGTARIGFAAYNINTTTVIYITKTVPVANTWYHFALTRQGTSFYVFLNGILENTYTGVSTAVDDASTSRVINIGGYPGDSQYWYGYMDEVRITKGIARYTSSFALPTRMYSTYSSPLVNQVTSAVVYPLDGLSQSAIQTAKGLYAIQRLLSNYTGPIVNIRRSADSATLNFYSDANANLAAFVNNVSVSLTAWLGTSIGYINTLYDQSGNANHATQVTTSLQPIINTYYKYIDFKTQANSYLNLPTGTIPQQKYYSVILRHNTTGNGNTAVGSLLGAGANTTNQGNYFYTNASGVYTNSWISNDFSSYAKYTPGAVCAWTFGPQGSIGSATSGVTSFYMNGSLASSPANRTSWAGVAGNETIGTNTPTANAALNGELYFVTIFASSIYDTDRNIVENISIIPTGLIANYDLTNSISYSGNTSPCVLDGLSLNAIASAKGLYASQRLLTSWTGPVMNIRRSYDSALMDFYADANGNLGTRFNATGISLLSWLSGSYGYVTTWYDQSGLGNHATQITNASQPQVNPYQNLLDFGTSTNTIRFALPNGTFPTGDGSYSIILRHGTIYTSSANGANGLFGSGTPGTNGTICSFVTAITGGSGYYRLYFYGNDYDTTTQTINAGNILSYTYATGAGTNSRKTYINGTLNIQNTPSAVRNSTALNNYIAYTESGNNNYLNGQLYYITIFSTVLSDNDRNIVENIGKYSNSTVVNDLSGNKNNLTLTYAPSTSDGQGVNSYVNMNTSGISQNTTVVDLSSGFTMETLVATKNTSTPVYNLNNGTGVSASVGSGANTIMGSQKPMEFPPTNLLTNMVSYLPLISNSTDYGSTPQTVTTNGSVSYPSIGGFNGLSINNNNANYLSFPYTFPYTFTLCFWLYVIDITYYTAISITTTGQLTANLCLQVDIATSTNVQVFTALPNQWTNSPTAAYGGISGWRFVAITVNLNTFYEELYIGSATTATATATGTGNGFSSRGPNLIMLGRSGDTGGRSYNGYIRQFALFNKVLTGSEINAYYNATLNNNIILTASQIFGNSIYGNGRYITSASAYQQSYCSDLAFDKTINTFGWQSTAGVYAATSGVYNATTYSTVASGQTYYGEWLQIRMPTCIYVTSYSLTCSTAGTTQFPYSWVIVASNDGSTWILIDTRNTQIPFTGQTLTYNINTPVPFIYYRIIVSGVQLGNGAVTAALITEMKYFGYQIIPNYINANLLAYYDFSIPSSYIGAGTTLNDISGNALNMTISNAGTYSQYPYAMTTATNTGFTVGYTTGFATGFTVELLINLSSTAGNQWLFQTGQYGTAGMISILNSGGTQLQLYISNTAYSYCTSPLQAGVWAHLVFSVSQVSNNAIYYNGVSQTMVVNTSLSGAFPLTAGSSMFIGNGTNGGFGGSIALARVYTYAFNANDAMQNYMNIIGTTNPYNLTTNNYVSDSLLTYPPVSLASATSVSGSGTIANGLYPTLPVFSQFVSGQTYGNGLYYISASTQYNANTNNQVFYLFNKVSVTTNTDQWSCSTAVYNTTTGVYTGTVYTVVNGINILGEWIQIQVPNATNVVSYTLYYASGVANRMPNTWYLLGSNDGNTWYIVDIRSSITGWTSAGITFKLNTVSNAYLYYRIVINKVQTSNDGYVSICEWVLNSINGVPSGTEIQLQSYGQYEYPPASLSTGVIGSNPFYTAITNQLYGNGLYITSTSTLNGSWPPYMMFGKSVNGDGNSAWASAGTYYTSSSYSNGVTTTVAGVSYSGEWIQIQSPTQFILKGYSLQAANTFNTNFPEMASSWVIAGSNDGSIWSFIDARSGQSYTAAAQINNYNINNNTNAFKYYRIIVRFINNASTDYAIIGEWRLFTNSISNALTVINNNNATNISNQYSDIVSEYPPAAMTADTTTLSGLNYGNGTYWAFGSTASGGNGGGNCGNTFDKTQNSGGGGWLPGGTYNGSTDGLYAGSVTLTVSGVVYNGEWLRLQLPMPIVISSYSIQSPGTGANTIYVRAPKRWIIAGSNDSITWTLVDTQSNQLTNGLDYQVRSFTCTPPSTGYSYYLILVLGIQSGFANSSCQIAELRYYGAPAINNNTFIQNTTNSINPTGAIAPLILEYPPPGMTANTTTITGKIYGNGAYIASASSELNTLYYVWYAFDKVNNLNASNQLAWTNSIAGIYNSTTGLYTLTTYSTVANNTTYYGEWIQIQMPQAIVLNSYSLTSAYFSGNTYYLGTPYNWIIVGSNNGTTWNIIEFQSTQVYSAFNITKTFNIANNTKAYSYYRFVILNIQPSNGGAYAIIGEWRLYGLPSISPSNYIPPNTIPVNNWTHGVLTVSKAGVWSWYLNGILSSSGNGFIIPTNVANYLAIGDYAGLNSLCGTIALSRLYNRTLTTAQVTNSYSTIANNYTLQSKVIDISGNNQFTSLVNIPTIPNASFEFPQITIGTYSIGVGTVYGWSTTATAGLNTVGSAFGMGIPPDGNQCLLLQSTGGATTTASTTMYGLIIGCSYTISFYLGFRTNGASVKPTLTITANTTPLLSLSQVDCVFAQTTTGANSSFVQYTTNPFTATASTSTLTISVYAVSDMTYFIDNMTINLAYTPTAIATLNTPFIPNPSFEVYLPNTLTSGWGFLSMKDGGTGSFPFNIVPGWIPLGTGTVNVSINNSSSAYSPPAMVDGNICLGLQFTSADAISPRVKTIISGLTPGQQYAISFYTAYRTSNNQSYLVVSVNGYQVYNSAISFTTFTKQTTNPFWASGTTAVLEFSISGLVSGTDSTNFIDLVTISPNTMQTSLIAPVIPNSIFQYITPMYTGANDPYFANTILLMHGDNTITDSSSYAATITNSGTTYNTTTKMFGAASLSFNGTSSYLLTPTSANYAFGTKDYTIELWIYLNGAQATNTYLISNNRGNATNAWQISCWNGFFNTWFAFNSTGSGVAISNNVWTHVAVVRNGTNLLMFKDGVMTTTAAFFGTVSIDSGTLEAIRIGYAWDTLPGLNGYIDDIRITKGFARYTTNFTVPTTAFPDYTVSYASSVSTAVAIPSIVIPSWTTSNNVGVLSGVGFFGTNALFLLQTSANTTANPATAITTIYGLVAGQSYILQLYVFVRQYVTNTANLKIYINGVNIYYGNAITFSSLTKINTSSWTATSSTATLMLVNDYMGTSGMCIINSISVQTNGTIYSNAIVTQFLPPDNTGFLFGGGLTIYTYAFGGYKYGPININGVAYYIHMFTTTGTSYFTVTGGTLICDILVVAGGGAGGYDRAGGGGAGGYQYFVNQTITTGSYTITVGAGGAGGTGQGAIGGNSQFGSFTASIGGGGGGSYSSGSVGGSGGGAANNSVVSGSAGTSGQGYAGGSSAASGTSYNAGGGGGAGGVGANATSASGGNGGIGIANNITGVLTYYAGGGGGSRAFDGGAVGTSSGIGGLGGGGYAGQVASQNGYAGIANTGGGGGGGANINQGNGGNGGSGVVIVRYKV